MEGAAATEAWPKGLSSSTDWGQGGGQEPTKPNGKSRCRDLAMNTCLPCSHLHCTKVPNLTLPRLHFPPSLVLGPGVSWTSKWEPQQRMLPKLKLGE